MWSPQGLELWFLHLLAVTKPVKFSPLTSFMHLAQRNVSLFTHMLKLIHLGLFILNLSMKNCSSMLVASYTGMFKFLWIMTT